jgi:hypothetical protein
MRRYIYYLCDADTKQIFYVGRTDTALNRRLRTHINSSRCNKSALSKKIQSLNCRIEIHAIEVITSYDINVYKLEMDYIRRYSLIHNLVNTQYVGSLTNV